MTHLEFHLRQMTIDQLLLECGINPQYKSMVNMGKQEIIEAILRKQKKYNHG